MKIEHVEIKRYKSIENGQLFSVNDFNVLIGKNNAGKSNILSAIQVFFICLQGGNVVKLNPPAGDLKDYYKKLSVFPIEITVVFNLQLAERDNIIRDIVAYAPPMANAADGLDPSLRLLVTVKIVPSPTKYAFVSKLALTHYPKIEPKSIASERVILECSEAAANELYTKLYTHTDLTRRYTAFDQILHSEVSRSSGPDLRSYYSSPKQQRPPIRYYLSNYNLTPTDDLVLQIEQIGNNLNSYEEFCAAIQKVSAQYKEDDAQIQNKPINSKVQTFSGEESSIPKYVTNILQTISNIDILHLTERRTPIGRNEAEQLLNLKITRGGPKILENIQETVHALLGVKIDAFKGEPSGEGDRSSAELDVDDFLIQANGAGIREALRIILDVELKHPQVLLVEEPEISLHPALETSVMQYLKRISPICQVFVSTHSTNFIDTATMNNVYLVSKNGSTNIHQLDINTAESLLPKELGLRLSSLFMYDHITLVEGPSDESVIRELASTLKINLSQSNVGFIHIGGARNFSYFAAESTLSFLTKRQVKITFIMDHDEKSTVDITKLKDRLGTKAIINVLKKREVENYLICPRAILELISTKRHLSGKLSDDELPSITELTKTINDKAEQLKTATIYKRVEKILCKPIYFPSPQDSDKKQTSEFVTSQINNVLTELGKAKASVESVFQEQTSQVNEHWKSDKLDTVPGDILLDLVFQEYGVRFKKEQGDGGRLASILKDTEIDYEIKQIISEIIS